MTRYSPRTGQPTEYQVGPYDSAHLYLQWGGKLPGAEQWSNGLRFASTATGTGVADAASMLSGAAAAVSAFHTHADTGINGGAKLSFVKLNYITTSGHYHVDSDNEATFADLAGGGGSAGVANQIALAVTTTTGYSRGPAHSGRFYLPMPVFLPDTVGLISGTARTACNARVTALFTALNSLDSAWDLAVFSRKAGAPTHRVITGSKVGRVLDTQRRRRRSLAEVY